MRAVLALILAASSFAALRADDPQDLVKAREAYQAEVKKAVAPIKDKYAVKLNDMAKALKEKGDAEGSAAVEKEIVALASEGDNSQATFFVNCDDAFELCVNGQELCAGKGKGCTIVEANLKKGDVITAKCVNAHGAYGFTCVIKFKDDKKIVTGEKTWSSYIPKNPAAWSDPDGVLNKKPVSVATNAEWKQAIINKSRSNCETVWGDIDGGIVYLTCEVK